MAFTLPREPKPGEPVKAETIAQLIRYAKSITPRDTPNLRWELGAGGAKGFAQGGGRRGSSITPPFTPYDVSTEGDPKISITPGLVDKFIPTLGGVSLVRSPAPTLSLTQAAGLVWIKNTLDAKGVITNSIIEEGAELPEDAETLAYRPLAAYATADGAITSLVPLLNANQSHKRCGGYSTWGAA